MAADEKEGGKLLSVQAARGIAALIVVLYHSGRMIALPQYVGFIPLGGFFNFGHAGVDFFFVLSGFIIYFIHSGDIGKPESARRYLWRRVTRIYPIYWIVTVVVVALAIAGSKLPEIGYLVKSLLLVPETRDPVLGVAWTLRHEILFYLVFLTLIVEWRAGILLFGLWAALIGAEMAGVSVPSFALQFIASPYHLQFFMGMGVAHVVLNRNVPIPKLLAVLGVVAFSTVGMAENAEIVPLEGTLPRSLYGIAAAVTLLGLAGAEIKGRLAVGKVTSFLGEASYSIYLLHTIVIGLTARILVNLGIIKAMPGWSVVMVTGITALAAALMLYQFIERPLLIRLQKFGRMHVYASGGRISAVT